MRFLNKIKACRKIMDKDCYEAMFNANEFELYKHFAPLILLNKHGGDHEREIAVLHVILHERKLTPKDLVEAYEAYRVMQELTEEVRPLILFEGDPKPMGNVATKGYPDLKPFLRYQGKPINTLK